jgi:5-formyltetrahydrofolate cyclo-ligase
MDGDVRQTADGSISRRLLDLVARLQPQTISSFWPIVPKGEVDIRGAIMALVESGIVVGLPKVSRSEPGVMNMHRFTTEDDMDANKWGGMEPKSGDPIFASEFDLIIVPALAADRSGNRVGYGGGYYDRFLNQVDAPAATIVYSSCLFDDVPTNPHDVAVEYVITEFDTIVTKDPAT